MKGPKRRRVVSGELERWRALAVPAGVLPELKRDAALGPPGIDHDKRRLSLTVVPFSSLTRLACKGPDAERVHGRALIAAGSLKSMCPEWAQNMHSDRWLLEEVEARLAITMRRAYENVAELAARKGVSLRIAAYAIALERIAAAIRAPEVGAWNTVPR